jgi:protein-disulfide isomerase
MTKKETRAELPSVVARGQLPWRARARFQVGKTRRQRQSQYRQQVNALLLMLLVVVVGGGVFIVINWRNAGSVKTVSCAEFPDFCVPLAGGSPDQPNLEAPGARTLDEASHGAEGVTRGVGQYGVATIGDPSAPVHFVMFSDYACPHCQDYHETDMSRIITNLVLTGQATFGMVMVTGTGGAFSNTASQAALCAGEQGAYWEMNEELFRLARSRNLDSAFSLSQISQSADQMGLDGQTLVNCVASNKYARFMTEFNTFANDVGVTGTPSVAVSYGDSGQWQQVDRGYDFLAQLAEAAQSQ